MRIIAGFYKGRKLASPDGEETVRPTADRVKESLFNILAYDVIGAAVLDLFSGSGALAAESISRGARFAVCCDRDTSLVRRNMASLGIGADKVQIINADYTDCLRRVSGTHFDIVFLDPPYRADYAAILAAARTLDAGLYVVEHDTALPVRSVRGYAVTDERKYGRTTVTFMKKENEL